MLLQGNSFNDITVSRDKGHFLNLNLIESMKSHHIGIFLVYD